MTKKKYVTMEAEDYERERAAEVDYQDALEYVALSHCEHCSTIARKVLIRHGARPSDFDEAVSAGESIEDWVKVTPEQVRYYLARKPHGDDE